MQPVGVALKNRCLIGFKIDRIQVSGKGLTGIIISQMLTWYLDCTAGTVEEAATEVLLDAFNGVQKKRVTWLDLSDELGISELQDQLKSFAGKKLDVSKIVSCTSVKARKQGVHLALSPGPLGAKMIEILAEAQRRSLARSDA